MDKDWKLKLRYGKLKTPYKHFTAIANGEVVEIVENFDYKLGKACMGMKTWASSADESADMIKVIGKQIGFNVTGNIEVYETEAKEPPKENPHGYDIQFTPYND